MESKKLFLSFFLFKSRINKKGLSPIYLRITIDGKRETIATGVFIDANYWDETKGIITENTPLAINQNHLLNSLKGKITGIYTELLNTGVEITTSAITKRLNAKSTENITLLGATRQHNAYVKKRIGQETTQATYVKYETLRTKLEGYIAKEYSRKDPLLSELTPKFIVHFELYLKTHEKIGHNTAIKYIQFLKRIINYSIANEWLKTNPFNSYRCKFKVVSREYLNIEEINIIQSKEISIKRLSEIRDIFIFSCYTGLAYADVKKLVIEEIVLGVDKNLWIQTFRSKTKTRVPVPLLPQALAIIQSYQEWRKEAHTNRAFPVPSNQKVNSYLKEIADLCGIKKKLTFHIARHSFATSVTLSNGVPIETVSKLLGHTNIKTTQHYAKVLDKKIADDMKKLSEGLI